MSTPLPVRTACLGWAFSFIEMPLIPYPKPAVTFTDQLQRLKNRGLIVEDDARALHLLEKISYYRLSGYWYPFLESPKELHNFKPKTTFDNSFQIYRFDRELRILISGELEKIEVAVRAKMIYVMAHTHGPFWFNNTGLFKDLPKHAITIKNLNKEYNRSEEEFIKSFKSKYSDPLPPCWMMFEISSFGTISSLYKNIKGNIYEKRVIANGFGLDPTTFESWLHAIVYIRNICAHHSRLWNKELRITPTVPSNPANKWLNVVIKNNTITGLPVSISNRVYCTLSMVIYLLNTINPSHTFIDKFKRLLKKYPTIDVSSMGFTDNWENEPLWQTKTSFWGRINGYFQ